MVQHQNVGHSKCIENYYDSIVDMCHANRFAVLQTSDSDSVNSKTDCQPDGTVKIYNGKQGTYKGKQISDIFTANCRQVVSDSNVNVKSNCHISPQPPNKSQNETVDSKTSTVGETGELEEGDKYALEINTVLKGEKIHLAKESTANKEFLNQNQPLFGFIPIYVGNTVTLCAKIFCHCMRGAKPQIDPIIKVPVYSKLNYEKWSQYLEDYWGWQLLV